MKEKSKAGAPKKEPTLTPSLRCPVDTWKKVKDKHAGKINKMFNEWLEDLANNKNVKPEVSKKTRAYPNYH